jgi:hypothetical protein
MFQKHSQFQNIGREISIILQQTCIVSTSEFGINGKCLCFFWTSDIFRLFKILIWTQLRVYYKTKTCFFETRWRCGTVSHTKGKEYICLSALSVLHALLISLHFIRIILKTEPDNVVT